MKIMIKNKIKKIIPKNFLSFYHYLYAYIGVVFYRFPSRKMIVIGVTGTKGKTSVANYVWSCLNGAGLKTGIISSAIFRIGDEERINDLHMTMPGHSFIPRIMAEMVKRGCRFCVVETTSEGLKQHRHLGINYDIAIFTGLFPEHLSAHGGSFQNYKEAKGVLFKVLDDKRKEIEGKLIPKTIIANIDNEHSDYFLSFKADRKITYGVDGSADYKAEILKEDENGTEFSVLGVDFKTSIPGRFNVYNSLPAIIISQLFEIDNELIQQGIKNLKLIPGRMEEIVEGQDFRVFVDYAHEKESMRNALEAVNKIKPNEGKIIVLLGGQGGGRDKEKRFTMGELAAKMADFVIPSNEDPYDEDPREIIENIASSAEKFGKIRDKNLFVIIDRREGIKKALSLARKGDIVLITGKGGEQNIMGAKGAIIPWDDRKVVREELKKLR